MASKRTFNHPNGNKYEYDKYTEMVTITKPDNVQVVEYMSESLLERLEKEGVPPVFTRPWTKTIH